MSALTQVSESALIDHVKFYVADIESAMDLLVGQYGFAVYAAGTLAGNPTARSVALGANQIRLVLSQPLSPGDRGHDFLDRHGDGVCEIALLVPDAAAAFHAAVNGGARPVAEPARHDGTVIASIMGFGDVVHSFVQRTAGPGDTALPGLRRVSARSAQNERMLTMDHFAVCVEAGQLEPIIEFYRRALGFEMIFSEQITVGAQAMNSKVVQSKSGAVTFTILEPDLSRARGQIDEFVASNGGAGIQHIALAVDDIVQTLETLKARGIEFLSTPASYYDLVADRLELSRHSVRELREHSILVDRDNFGQLFQIFARSVHPRQTFFFEIIERVGARTFGTSNIKALYEAVEVQRLAGQAGAANSPSAA